MHTYVTYVILCTLCITTSNYSADRISLDKYVPWHNKLHYSIIQYTYVCSYAQTYHNYILIHEQITKHICKLTVRAANIVAAL